MFDGLMSYGYFLFWYSFIIAWFFIAAAVIYYVVLKDVFEARKERAEIRVTTKQVSTLN